MYSVLYTAVPGPTGIANSFQQRRQHDRARTHRVQKGEKEWKIWPSSTQYSLPVSDPAGRRASLSPDHKGNQQNHRPGQTSRSNAQRKKGTRTQHTYQRNTQGVPEDLIHFFSNLNLHISAPTFTHMGDYPARPMEGKIPLTHTSPCL